VIESRRQTALSSFGFSTKGASFLSAASMSLVLWDWVGLVASAVPSPGAWEWGKMPDTSG
jgi:hypothetical protein